MKLLAPLAIIVVLLLAPDYCNSQNKLMSRTVVFLAFYMGTLRPGEGTSPGVQLGVTQHSPRCRMLQLQKNPCVPPVTSPTVDLNELCLAIHRNARKQGVCHALWSVKTLPGLSLTASERTVEFAKPANDCAGLSAVFWVASCNGEECGL